MFHRALTRRKRLEIGTRLPVAGSTAWKSATPCASGPTPVTIVVHRRGEIIGSYDRPGPFRERGRRSDTGDHAGRLDAAGAQGARNRLRGGTRERGVGPSVSDRRGAA